MSRVPKKVYVVSHTHWDREWYQTVHRFRVDLVRVVRKVLDALDNDPSFRHFVLDGQSIVLEDYLELCPEDEPRVRRLVGSGRLSIGPWYILPDEFLVSGEATVRNLQLGHRVASRVGPVQAVGYMPDSFGHIAQMPQLLRGAGLDNFVYTRGDGDAIETTGLEHTWVAPDGSEVLAIHQHGGYCNAGALGLDELWLAHTPREIDPERAVAQVQELFDRMAPLARSDVWLLNNGCDHFPPQRELGVVLARLAEAFPGTEFVHGSYAEYLAAVREAGHDGGRHEGERIHGRLHHILSGVWSARMPLKQQNDACQTLLGSKLEPLLSYARFGLGLDYPARQVEDGWKRLLQNHPHDSICGCSTDDVHREMVTRFDGVIETAEQLLRRTFEEILPTFARQSSGDRNTAIAIFNPLPESRSEIVERMIVLQPPAVDVANLELVDESGRPVPFEVRERLFVERFWGIDYRTLPDLDAQRRQFAIYRDTFGPRILRDASEGDRSDTFLTLRFRASDLPPLGHRLFRLRETNEARPRRLETSAGGVRIEDERLSNDRIAVRLRPDGSFDLEDLRDGRRFPGLNALVDMEDVGDEYDWSPATSGAVVASEPGVGGVRVVEDDVHRATLAASFVLRLPEGIAADRTHRSERLVDCPGEVRVTLVDGSPLVDVELELDNRARDHRLRAGFPTTVASSHVLSDGQFYVHRRPVEKPDGEEWVQPPPTTYPQQEFSAVDRDGRGLAVFNRGLPEIEAERRDGQVTLWLTLLRSVEWLSRDDFVTRRQQNAGPTLHTPEAQCLGRQRFRYAVLPYQDGWLEADLKGTSRRWRTPLRSIQGVEDGARRGDGLLSKATSRSEITAIRCHATRDTLIVRLVNLSSEPVTERLTLGPEILAAWQCDLLEERGEPLTSTDAHVLEVRLAPHRIVTVELELAPPTGRGPDSHR